MTVSSRALLFGGDALTQAALTFLLTDIGCAVRSFADPLALTAALQQSADILIVIVTGNAPDSGSALLSGTSKLPLNVPMLVLTRRRDQHFRRQAFVRGAVDVIGLPASPRELQARFRAVVGQPNKHDEAIGDVQALRAGGLTLHVASRTVSDAAGWHTSLTKREAAVLATLMRQPGRVVHRHELLDHVWGQDYNGDGNLLEVHVRRLRMKLAQSSLQHDPLQTRRGQGYVFEARSIPRQRHEARHAGPPRILVVCEDEATTSCGDDPPLAGSLATILGQAGYAVAPVGRADAMALAGLLRPAALLLLATIDVEAAAEFCTRLRTDARTTSMPIIAVVNASTAHAYALKLEVADFVTVPPKADDLLLRVEMVMGSALDGSSVLHRRPVSQAQASLTAHAE